MLSVLLPLWVAEAEFVAPKDAATLAFAHRPTPSPSMRDPSSIRTGRNAWYSRR